MNTIGDALNPVYINDRGVPKKISEGAGALKDKLAIGMDANGALKATDLATGGAGYDDTKIATKGYIDANNGGDILREILTDYQHLPYVSSEASINSYGITLEVHSDTDENEYTVPCDSILRISAIPSRKGNALGINAPIMIKYNFEIYNTLIDDFVKFYTPNCTVLNTEQYQDLSSTISVATSVATDKIDFYIQAGSRIRYRRVSTNGWDVDITAVLVPIIKYNQITTKKFIPDCNVVITPSRYSCIVTPSTNEYTEDTEQDGVIIPAYRGRQLKPTVVVTDNEGTELVENTDYIVAYGTNTMLPAYPRLEQSSSVYLKRDFTAQGTVVIVGIGNWTSSKTLKFNMTSYDYRTPVIYVVAYKSYTGAGALTVLGSAMTTNIEYTKLPATVKFRDGSDTSNRTLELGGSVSNVYTTTGKKYFTITYSDGSSETSYLEM